LYLVEETESIMWIYCTGWICTAVLYKLAISAYCTTDH